MKLGSSMHALRGLHNIRASGTWACLRAPYTAQVSTLFRMKGLRGNSFAALLNSALEKEAAAVPTAASTAGGNSVTKEAATADGGKLPKKIQDPLVWVDLEMTGLDITKDTIIEIAVIITDGQLQHEIEGPAFAIHQSDEVLDNMNDWCKENHGKSGLTQRVRDSIISMEEAQQQVLDFVKMHVPECHTAQLAGNSVHVDRQFLVKYMPELIEHLHYRIVDVSTIKELARRWFIKEWKTAPRKVLAHTALSDIKESIQELKHWRRTIFKSQGQGR